MAEKNISVTHGIPMGPSGFGGGSSTGGGRQSSHSGGTGSFSWNIGLNGNPVGGGGAGGGNPSVMLGEIVEESRLSGQGWPSLEVYTDLGVDAWNLLPLQIEQLRMDIANDFNYKVNLLEQKIDTELQAAGVSASSVETINRSVSIIQDKIASREISLGASIDRFIQYPDKNFGTRSIGVIMAELRSLSEDDVPAAIDRELDGTQAALEVSMGFYGIDLLERKARNLIDTRNSIQAIAMAKALAVLNGREQSQLHEAEPLVKLEFLRDSEGGLKLTGYVPKSNGVALANSGVTVGVGVDLGSKSNESLRKDGVPENLVQQLSEYVGLKGVSASNKLTQKPLMLSEPQATLLSKIYFEKTAKSIEARYNSVVGEGAFREVPIYTRTAVISLAYQYGDNLAVNAPKYWSAITRKDWAGAMKELNGFGDAFPGRRASEAKMIGLDLEFGYFK